MCFSLQQKFVLGRRADASHEQVPFVHYLETTHKKADDDEVKDTSNSQSAFQDYFQDEKKEVEIPEKKRDTCYKCKQRPA